MTPAPREGQSWTCTGPPLYGVFAQKERRISDTRCFLSIRGQGATFWSNRFRLLDFRPSRNAKMARTIAIASKRGSSDETCDDTRTAPVHVSARAAHPRKLPNRLLRYCINVWVLLHFTAIIAAAASIGPCRRLRDGGLAGLPSLPRSSCS